MSNPEDTQIGGDHYKNLRIQPSRFLYENDVRFLEGEIIKRLICWREPSSDGIDELKKARHEIDLLIHYAEMRYES